MGWPGLVGVSFGLVPGLVHALPRLILIVYILLVSPSSSKTCLSLNISICCATSMLLRDRLCLHVETSHFLMYDAESATKKL